MSGLTLRAFILGLIQVLLVCIGAPYAIWFLGTSEITWSFFPIGVGFPFLCLLLVNRLVTKINPARALRPSELVTVVVMGLVVTGIPIFMVGLLLAIPTTPYYLASPENQWADLLIPHMPAWLLPGDEDRAMTWFFEALPAGAPVPWGKLAAAWIGPLFWWLSFIGMLYFVCFALVVILRKQWIDRERLAFPLMAVPQRLITDGGSSPDTAGMLRQRLFWAGAAIPLGLAAWNIAAFFLPVLSSLPWDFQIAVARGFPPVNVRLYFPVVGFMYFAPLNVAFSIWFFYGLTSIEEGVFNRLNMGITTTDAFVWGLPSTSWQCWGAFVTMVLWGLWMARGHLRDVVRKTLNPSFPVDDSKELLSYRTAGLGVVFGVAYLLGWLCRAGLPLIPAALLLACILIAYLGITRVVIQTGVYYVTTPVVGQAMTMAALGTGPITHSGLAAMGLTYAFFGDVQSIFMPAAAHAARLHDAMRTGRRGLTFAIVSAVLVGFVAAVGCIVVLGYLHGASNFRSWFFQVSSGAGVRAFEAVTGKIIAPEGMDAQKLAYFGSGAAGMALLTMMQYRFPWWPLHPVGLPIAAVWMIRNQAAAIFAAWALKSLLLRFGGIGLYRRATPFFVGLIAGHFLGVGVSFLVDMVFFPGTGHPILHG
jgi:hypothetical protein